MGSILVTGATGFIGSRLVSALLEKGHSVSTLVRTGKHTKEKTDEIVGDLTDPNLSFEGYNFDCVFHLASHTPLEKNSKILENVNLNGTKNLFEAILGKTKSIIYISGLGVYGDPGDEIIDESYPYNPNTNFVKIRLKAQQYLEKKCNENKINFSVVHFGDVYGAQGWFHEILIKRLLKKSFRLPGGGKYSKGFVNVDDAVGSMIAVMDTESFGESFIVADSQPATFKDFVDFTADQIGKKHPGNVPIFLAKAALGADLVKLLTTSMKVSNSKISKIYSFKYPSFREGIPEVIEELKQNSSLEK
jgi:nucleoside-diphosphate-sugar epimerase